ncbi:hypothetical protein CKM354_000911400 [Cercospora kikuchii]|uniref:cyclin-dependent kinase n=1 Tax=Cercospora kikuchii TaxID=84275 RepID=A0A9P3CUI4_9PEZI|nr:uncharacterized protein CKM354_000911400 [Cercospora kikuchii]GIZ45970.1 hypothetical protein CKM354_000911400 [Cercospora kikuchii]
MVSRWADTEEDKAEDARRKAEKEEKKRLKAEKQRKAEEAQRAAAARANGQGEDDSGRPAKRRRLSQDGESGTAEAPQERKLMQFHAPSWQPTRSIERFDLLNHIEEGSYGYVSRAREEATGEIVAIKKLKMDPIRDGGFPVTALREIQTLQASKHRHIVTLREIVTGSNDTAPEVFLVMDFLEHDLKTLQEEMDEPFLPSETKTLMLQLCSAVDFLHSNWILHRDLKTSNILMNNRGEIKLADFGMARLVGDPAPSNLTQLVVTLWYRAPELLLGTTTYDSSIDIWSLGCIFGELVTREPLFQGKNEVDQLSKIFSLCGIPTTTIWPNFKRLPNARSLRLPSSSSPAAQPTYRTKFPTLPTQALALLTALLSLNPTSRPSAKEILEHPYFISEAPRPKPTAMFPTFPSKAGQERRRRKRETPNAPQRGVAPGLGGGQQVDFSSIFAGREEEVKGAGFQLKVA